jgi:putative transposase
VKGKVLGRKVLRDVAGIVTPDTIFRWYGRLVARKYDGSKNRGSGRPSTAISELVVRMARENPGWGYTRIRDALRRMSHQIARAPTSSALRF